MNCESVLGCTAFHRSLSPKAMTASLTSGLPSRETCTHGPVSVSFPVPGSIMRALRRLAVDQTPMTDLGLLGSVGLEPSRVSMVLGTWMAIVCTLYSLVPLTP